MKSNITFIIVAYRTPTSELLRLRREIMLISKSFSIVVIDNTKTNRGFAEGANEGIQEAKGSDYFVVMNPDVSLKGMKKETLLAGSRHFDIWGGAMEQNGRTYFGGIIDPIRLSGGLMEKKPMKRFTRVDFVSGSFMVIKRDVIEKVGLLEELYGMYYEDVDYCYRAQKSGFSIGIDTRLHYIHFENSVTSPQKDYFLAKNRMLFFLKNATLPLKIRELIRTPKTLWQERKTIMRAVRRSAFILNFASLNVSSILNKLLNFVLFLFLIKYLSPAEYGIYTVVWAQVSLLGPFLDFGTTSYGLIYGNETKNEHLSKLFSFRIIVSVLSFVATLLLALLFRFQTSILGFVALASMVMFFNMSSGSYLILMSLREKVYDVSRLSVVLNSILIGALIVSLIVTQSLQSIFAVLFILYSVFTVFYLYLLKKELPALRFIIDTVSWKEIVRKSYIFVLISFFAGIYFKADVFLLNSLQSETAVGTYSAGYKFLEALVFIAASYNIIATPLFVKLATGKKAAFVWRIKRDVAWLSMLGFVTAIGAFIAGPHVLPVFLKTGYRDSVTVAVIVLFSLPFIFMSSVFINVLYVLKKTYLVAILFAVQIAFNITANYLLIPHYSYLASSYITVFSEIINTILFMIAAVVVINKFRFSDTK